MKDHEYLASELGLLLGELRYLSENPGLFYLFRRINTGKKLRTLRIPKGRLAAALAAVKEKLLDRMPLPESVHGWRKGRSPKTYGQPHVGRAAVVNCDIQDFFPSVSAGRVYGFWMSAGYDAEASKTLTRLTTIDNQLPQGSITSAALGNLVLAKLHRRLGNLARLHDLRYSSYGDEFSMSGRRRVTRLKGLMIKIVEQEGFKVNPSKVKVMERHERQELAGNVVNRKLSRGRSEYRELRAIIHNCAKSDPQAQNLSGHPNFEAHLRGRIAQFQFTNAELGAKLLAKFDQIIWPEAT